MAPVSLLLLVLFSLGGGAHLSWSKLWVVGERGPPLAGGDLSPSPLTDAPLSPSVIRLVTRALLVASKIPKFYKISRYIEFFNTFMKY